MNASTFLTWTVARLAGAPLLTALLFKATALLALAWELHAGLAGRNPRWRVALWRGTAVALAVLPTMVLAPPFVVWRLPGPTPAPVATANDKVAPADPTVPPDLARLDSSTTADEPRVAFERGPLPRSS